MLIELVTEWSNIMLASAVGLNSMLLHLCFTFHCKWLVQLVVFGSQIEGIQGWQICITKPTHWPIKTSPRINKTSPNTKTWCIMKYQNMPLPYLQYTFYSHCYALHKISTWKSLYSSNHKPSVFITDHLTFIFELSEKYIWRDRSINENENSHT